MTSDDELLALIADMSESEIEQFINSMKMNVQLSAGFLQMHLYGSRSKVRKWQLTSDADIIGYGGAAGGGKTDLIIGSCLTA